MSYEQIGKGPAPPSAAAAPVLQAQPVPSAPTAQQAVPIMAPQLHGMQPAQATPVAGYGVAAMPMTGAQPGYGMQPAQAIPLAGGGAAVPMAGAQPGYGMQPAQAMPMAGGAAVPIVAPVASIGGIASLAQFGDLLVKQRVEMVRRVAALPSLPSSHTCSI